jgi:hypothetical protein
MAAEHALPALVAEKLAAFDRLEPEFETSFQYVQDVQGQRRFPEFPIAATVHYLHALWVCECKDRLLSVPRTIQRYEGRRCLELLRQWHGGESTDVVAFLQRRLDGLPFAEITRQLEAARSQQSATGLTQRLRHGRQVLLNRSFNLYHAFDPIFGLPEEELIAQVRAACAQYGHTPGAIEEQLDDLGSRLYAYVRHPSLAQRNMVVMDRLGVQVTAHGGNQPGQRTWKIVRPTVPPGPYAEQVISGYLPLTSPRHNNPQGTRFIDRPEPIDLPPDAQPEADVRQLILAQEDIRTETGAMPET